MITGNLGLCCYVPWNLDMCNISCTLIYLFVCWVIKVLSLYWSWDSQRQREDSSVFCPLVLSLLPDRVWGTGEKVYQRAGGWRDGCCGCCWGRRHFAGGNVVRVAKLFLFSCYQHTRELISARNTGHKHNNKDLSCRSSIKIGSVLWLCAPVSPSVPEM